jgi:hypothetical protein
MRTKGAKNTSDRTFLINERHNAYYSCRYSL